MAGEKDVAGDLWGQGVMEKWALLHIYKDEMIVINLWKWKCLEKNKNIFKNVDLFGFSTTLLLCKHNFEGVETLRSNCLGTI